MSGYAFTYSAENDDDDARRGQGPSESWPPVATLDPWPIPDIACPPTDDAPLLVREDAREYLPAGARFLRANATKPRTRERQSR